MNIICNLHNSNVNGKVSLVARLSFHGECRGRELVVGDVWLTEEVFNKLNVAGTCQSTN
jgi:hypothetical protein